MELLIKRVLLCIDVVSYKKYKSIAKILKNKKVNI